MIICSQTWGHGPLGPLATPMMADQTDACSWSPACHNILTVNVLSARKCVNIINARIANIKLH